ncbi:MAG: hypothetical protein ABIN36_05140 [Ferruginibacter sp.]
MRQPDNVNGFEKGQCIPGKLKWLSTMFIYHKEKSFIQEGSGKAQGNNAKDIITNDFLS